MKEFEVVCPLTREPRLKEIEAKAGGWKWVLKKRSIDARKEPVWRYQYEAYGPGETYVPYELPEALDVHNRLQAAVAQNAEAQARMFHSAITGRGPRRGRGLVRRRPDGRRRIRGSGR